MHRLLLLLLALLLAVIQQSVAADLRFGENGLDIDADTLGKFTLTYPVLRDAAQQPVHKLLEKHPSGKAATLTYDGGGRIDASVGEDGRVLWKLTNTPADVKSVAVEMLIPIAFNQGGTWHIGEKDAAFPKEKPANAHLFQGHAPALLIANYEGGSLELQTPEYSFLELTDNREWNWPIFGFRCATPLAERKELAFTLKLTKAEAGQAKPLVDRFGQSTREEWPGKIKSEDEFKTDAVAEETWLASLHPPERDAYGGLPGSGGQLGLKATGFFHVEQKKDRWFLVDPAGNAFFHLGLCGANPSDDYTLVKGRESAYEWLPKHEGEFATVFQKDSGGNALSFYVANLIRKTGQPYDPETYAARLIPRLRKWGFNSLGAFSTVAEVTQKAAQFPRVAHLPLSEWEGIPRLPSIGETFDPFEEKNRARLEENMAKLLPAHVDDPLIIGYFIVNEPIYENIPHMVPTFDGKYACKRRLVQWLSDKYQTIAAYNTAWESEAASFDDLKDRVLTVKSATAKQDVHAFTGVFLEEYFRIITESYRKHDPQHLLIGCRLQPGTINDEQLCRIAGKYLDVMSFNYYTNGVDKDFLRRIYGWTGGRPMMMSEFFWGASKESGLAGGREVATQQERGLAYRNYVEQCTSLGFVVGIEWFTLIDQSVTGRWFQGFDGERANTGILAVTDRPWKTMLEEAIKTNYGIYQVWLGKQEPFVFDDPRFKNTP
ncbi:MAG: beta-galactosidase [Chthoniobacter sp.]|uniref:beta-galactosidase n=1 Tax=Chthoniobacter sp. TaxID=2510640 RepID=UPI0032A60A0A